MTAEAISSRIDQAAQFERADIVIKNVRALDVIQHEIYKTDIAICGDRIVNIGGTFDGKTEIDAKGLIAVPGFVDAHQHIESSLLTPLEQDRLVLPRGTTTIMWDPHEIANVMGMAAMRYAGRASAATLTDIYVGLSSCVPAVEGGDSGAVLDVEHLKTLDAQMDAYGLAEFMNIGGVIGKAPDVIAKLVAFKDRQIDGHLPGIRGNILSAMAAAGVMNDHESTALDEAKEKLRKGLNVFARYGSAARNVPALAPLFQGHTAKAMGFCTDDRNPVDIVEKGHINGAVAEAIKNGADPISAYVASSYGAATSFGLSRPDPKWVKRGALAPGWLADIVLVSDFKNAVVHSVFKNGLPVTAERFKERKKVRAMGFKSVDLPEVKALNFAVFADSDVLVIKAQDNQIVTSIGQATLQRDGIHALKADRKRDILQISVIERHGYNNDIGHGFIQGLGLKKGAIATTVGHDDHNITVIGDNRNDMAVAVNHLRDIQGGYVVVHKGEVIADLGLDICGLISSKPYEEVVEDLRHLLEKVKVLKPKFEEPFMTAAFMSLSVIPSIKITPKGYTIFNPANGDAGPQHVTLSGESVEHSLEA